MTTKLEAIRAREQAATPGEWANVGRSVRVDGTTGGNAWQGAICNTIGGGYQSRKADRVNVQARANAAFIAHARADIPLLLAAVRTVAELPPGFLYSLAKDMRRRGGQVEMQLADAIEAVAKAIAPLLEDVDKGKETS